MNDASHNIKKILAGDDKKDGGEKGREGDESGEDDDESSLSEEEKKERRKQKALKVEPALRKRVEDGVCLPVVKIIQQRKREREGQGEGGGEEAIVAVANYVVNGGLAKDLYVELMNMMLMKWDKNAYRGGCTRG